MLSIGVTHTSGLTAAKVAHQAEPVCTDPKGSTPYELHKKYSLLSFIMVYDMVAGNGLRSLTVQDAQLRRDVHVIVIEGKRGPQESHVSKQHRQSACATSLAAFGLC